MKKTRGFTIVELLAVIFILSLLSIMAVSYFGRTQKSIESEKNKTKAQEIEDAIEVFYHLRLNDDTLKKYYLDDLSDSRSVVTCIKIGSLVESGYLEEEEYEQRLNNVLKITYKDGKMTIEKEIDGSKTEEIKEACSFEEISVSGVYDKSTSSQAGDEEEVDAYTFDQTVSVVDVNSFNVDIDFSFQALVEIVGTPSTYVIISLDTSGSMGSNIHNANTAVTTMFKDFANSEYNVCVAFINMGSSAVLQQPFTNKPYTASTTAINAENYTHSLWMAYDMFFTPQNELPKNYATGGPPDTHASGGTVTASSLGTKIHDVPECAERLEADNKILLFMSDGVPVSAWNHSTMYDASNRLKNNNVKVITYRYGSHASETILTQLATQKACTVNGKENQNCMYNTGSSDFIQQLQQFVITTINEIKASAFKNATIELTINDKYFACEKGSEKIGVTCTDSNKVIIEVDLSKFDASGKTIGDFGFNIKYIGKIDSANSVPKDPVTIFNAGTINFYEVYAPGKAPDKQITITNLPKVLITQKSESAVN